MDGFILVDRLLDALREWLRDGYTVTRWGRFGYRVDRAKGPVTVAYIEPWCAGVRYTEAADRFVQADVALAMELAKESNGGTVHPRPKA